MRQRVERFLRIPLLAILLPLVLGLGFALIGACKAHVSSKADPPVASRVDAGEPVGDFLQSPLPVGYEE
jgi:hypothetical protein